VAKPASGGAGGGLGPVTLTISTGDPSHFRWGRGQKLFGGEKKNETRGFTPQSLFSPKLGCAPKKNKKNRFGGPWVLFKLGLPGGPTSTRHSQKTLFFCLLFFTTPG